MHVLLERPFLANWTIATWTRTCHLSAKRVLAQISRGQKIILNVSIPEIVVQQI